MDILLVDDAESVRKNISRLISSAVCSANIFEACNFAEAEKELGKRPYKLVLFDIKLPDGSGFDLVRKIPGHFPFPLVLFVSNFAGEKFRQKAIELGANGFFDKTSEIDELIATIRSLA